MQNRRDKGNGSISKRKDGMWTARIELGRDINGKRKIKAFYGVSKADVSKKLKQYQIEMIKYDKKEAHNLTVAELLTYWLYNIKYHELKSSSFDRLEVTVNKHILPAIGYYHIDSITPVIIQEFINNETAKGYSYSTIKKTYNAINAVFRTAVERDYIIKSPCIGIVLPKQIKRDKNDIVFFTDEEVKRITESATEQYSTGRYIYKHGYAITILLNTGMRVGELLALKWCNVDMNGRQIHITETRGQVIDRAPSKQKYIMADRTTKTGAGNRYIPINNQTAEALHYFMSLGYKSPYVMANSDNNVITYRNLYRVLSNILEKNGISHGSLHSLRHTFATRLFRNGIDIKVISELLGHSDVSITYNIYTHVIQEQKKKAIDILDNL